MCHDIEALPTLTPVVLPAIPSGPVQRQHERPDATDGSLEVAALYGVDWHRISTPTSIEGYAGGTPGAGGSGVMRPATVGNLKSQVPQPRPLVKPADHVRQRLATLLGNPCALIHSKTALVLSGIKLRMLIFGHSRHSLATWIS